MKIAFLTPEYPHERIRHGAGIGTSIKNLAIALVKKGCVVTVIVYGQKEPEIFENEGVTIHLIEDKQYSFGKWFLYRKHIQNYCNKIIKGQHIDILEAPDWTGITAFMHFSIPLVIRFHGSDTYFCHLEKRRQKQKNFWLEKLAINKAKAFITPTDYAGNVSKEIFGIKKKIVKTIHHGLQLEKFENLNPEIHEKGLILYIGTIIRKKGVLELPEIFNLVRKQHPEARLILIGGDSFDAETQSPSTWQLMQHKFQQKDRDKVAYLGKISYEKVQEYIKRAQVCVFPTFAETLGMVTIESMAMQKPVVNSNIGWSKELIIDGDSGFLVYPKNHVEFAARIISIFDDNLLAKKLGENARKRVETYFDIDKIADENISFYTKLIETK